MTLLLIIQLTTIIRLQTKIKKEKDPLQAATKCLSENANIYTFLFKQALCLERFCMKSYDRWSCTTTDKFNNKFRLRTDQFVSEVDIHWIKSCIVSACRPLFKVPTVNSYKTNKFKQIHIPRRIVIKPQLKAHYLTSAFSVPFNIHEIGSFCILSWTVLACKQFFAFLLQL